MPEPRVQFINPSAEKDAEKIRERSRELRDGLLDLFGVPPTSVMGDQARREKLAKSSEEVAKIAAALVAISSVVPGPAGKAIAFFGGVTKTPGGEIKVAPGGAAGNFAPAPIGYLDPTSIGLQRNFYLPAGSSQFIPRRADQFGLGIPQQRAEDEERARRLAATTASANALRALTAVSGESDETLQDIINRRGGLSRAGVIIATSGVPLVDLQVAAAAELEGRGGNIVDAVRRIIAAAQARAGGGGPAEQAGELQEIFRLLPPDP